MAEAFRNPETDERGGEIDCPEDDCCDITICNTKCGEKFSAEVEEVVYTRELLHHLQNHADHESSEYGRLREQLAKPWLLL